MKPVLPVPFSLMYRMALRISSRPSTIEALNLSPSIPSIAFSYSGVVSNMSATWQRVFIFPLNECIWLLSSSLRDSILEFIAASSSLRPYNRPSFSVRSERLPAKRADISSFLSPARASFVSISSYSRFVCSIAVCREERLSLIVLMSRELRSVFLLRFSIVISR